MTHPQSERRRQSRRRSLIGAELRIGRISTTRCIMRNFTEAGARLVLSESVPLTDRFELTASSWAESRQAELVWRSGDAIGVSFVRPRPAAIPVSLDLMRELRAVRADNAALKAGLAERERGD